MEYLCNNFLGRFLIYDNFRCLAMRRSCASFRPQYETKVASTCLNLPLRHTITNAFGALGKSSHIETAELKASSISR